MSEEKLPVIEIAERYITRPGQLYEEHPDCITKEDGLGLYRPNHAFHVHDCIIDLGGVPLDEQDEAVAVTWGAIARFDRCIICNAGKLFLIGSGDKGMEDDEKKKLVEVNDCIIGPLGRRGPEVQSGMVCVMNRCLVKEWAHPEFFTVRSFGAWAHSGGLLRAHRCVFMPIDKDEIPLKQRLLDRVNHISQAVKDDGLKALFDSRTYLAGYRRACTGNVVCTECYAFDDAVIDNNENPIQFPQASVILDELTAMESRLISQLVSSR